MASEKLFKTFNESLIESLDLKCKRQFYYMKDSVPVNLKEVKVDQLSASQVYKLEDSTRKWNELRKSQSLFLTIEISMSHIVHIFYSENKVCHPQTVLGLGLEWKSKDSKVKYCKKLCTIDNSLDDLIIKIEDIEIPSANSDIEFRWFIYISEPGKDIDDPNEKYANSAGLVLAKEHWWTILVSGNGSLFPIDEFSKFGQPLWSIKTCFTDWAVDEFSIDNVSVTFNPSHPLFELINFGGEEFNEDIFKEVMSSALAALIIQIISEAKQSDDYDLLLEEPTEENGSILAAIRYFKKTHNFAIGGSVDELIHSIKMFFDKEKSLC